MNQCLNCQKDTINPKFCCRACSASVNNKLYVKRPKQDKHCCDCSAIVKANNKRCYDCQEIARHKPKKIRAKNITPTTPKPHTGRKLIYRDFTLAEAVYKTGNRCNAFGLVRNRARTLYLHHNKRECKICGYTKHIEVAHIRPIRDFPLTTLVSEVNKLENLIGLCPNCHWEYDHPNNVS